MKIRRVLVGLWALTVLGASAGAGPVVSIEAIQPLGNDEVVVILNSGSAPLDLGGWRLESSNSRGQEVKETFYFPRHCLLDSGGSLRIHSGPAARGWSGSSCAGGELGWLGVEVWNDKADVAWLRDAAGELVDLYTYTIGEAPARPTPLLKPGEKAELPSPPLSGLPCRLPEPPSAPWCLPRCLCGSCCVVRVVLESLELLYNRNVGENWRFFASAGPIEPEVFPERLPQVLYEEVFKGETFVQFGAGAVEQDLRPDRGWVQQELRLCCPLSPFERTVALELYVRENEGCCSGCTALWRFTFKITVEPFTWKRVREAPPRALFTIAPPGDRRLGDSLTLDGSPSVGEGLSYAWDFDGDGKADAAGQSVSYKLTRPGMNLITLTVTDRWGESDALTKGIRVEAEAVQARRGEGLDLGLFWLTLPALAVGYFLAMAFRG